MHGRDVKYLRHLQATRLLRAALLIRYTQNHYAFTNCPNKANLQSIKTRRKIPENVCAVT